MDTVDRELAVPDYSPAFRPARVVDLMHEAVSSYSADAIAFYPLMDAIILLLAKPLALVFHRAPAPGHAPQPFFVTYPEVKPAELATRFSQEKDLALTLMPLPSAPGRPGESPLFVSIADIVEVDDPDGGPKRLLVLPHRVPIDHVDPNLPPDGLDGQKLDLWLLRRLVLELDWTTQHGSSLSARVLTILNNELLARAKSPMAATRRRAAPWSDNDLPEWTSVADEVVSNHWRQIVDESLPREPVGTNFPERHLDTTLRFLVVFRFALPGAILRCKSYTYGARIILGRRQRARLRAWLHANPVFRDSPNSSDSEKQKTFEAEFGRDPEAVLAALELPLGLNYRSISDTHFGSGFIDFAPEATFAKEGERSGPASTGISEFSPAVADAERGSDTRRKAAEMLILDERGSRVFYVPIHIGGIPWLGLLVLEDAQRGADVSDVTWKECYHLYRGIVTIIGQQMRLSSRKAYIASLSRVLLQQLSDTRVGPSPIEEINKKWARLSAFFPFDGIQLERARPGDNYVIDLPGGERVALKASDNVHACFAQALSFDRLPLPAVHHELEIVMQSVVAKRLSALAQQESAWAHDVKNWTLPILKDLTAVLQKSDLDESTEQHVYTALVYARILNATAFARQTASDQQRAGSPGQNALAHYFAKIRYEAELQELLTLAADLLLTTHADIPKNRVAFELVWPGKRPLRTVMQDLADLVSARTTSPSDRETLSSDPTAVIGFPVIIWPLSLLREVVQNIKINNPLAAIGCEDRRIRIDYDFTRRGGSVVMTIRQTNHERFPWSDGSPRGLRKANILYGPMGANIGIISEKPSLDQTEIVVKDSNGKQVPAVEVVYSIDVEFFLGDFA